MNRQIKRIKDTRESLYKRLLNSNGKEHYVEGSSKYDIYIAIKNGIDKVTDEAIDNLDAEGRLVTIGYLEYLSEAIRKTLEG